MAVDLKGEFTRPLALILAALATLGWVLFGLSSWSAASVQKVQRLRIIELSDKSDKAAAELSRQVQASGALAELEKKVAATRDDLGRMSQAKTDSQTELSSVQQKLSATRRDLTEIDRTVQSQSEKLSEMQTGATEAAPEPQAAAAPRSYRRKRWTRRGRSRSSRSYSIMSR